MVSYITHYLDHSPIAFVVVCVAVVGVLMFVSLGVVGSADCGPGVKPGGWLIDFCRTSRIFSCKLCLFGNISMCFICKISIDTMWISQSVSYKSQKEGSKEEIPAKMCIPEIQLCLLSSGTFRTFRTDPWQVDGVVPIFCDDLFRRPHLVMIVMLDYLHCQWIGVVFVVSVVNDPFRLYLNLNIWAEKDTEI